MKRFTKFNENIFVTPVFFLLIFISLGVYTFSKIKRQTIDYNLNRLESISQNQELMINIFYDNLLNRFSNLPNSAILQREIKSLRNAKSNKNPVLDEFFKNYMEEFGLITLVILDENKIPIYYYSSNEIFGEAKIKHINLNDFNKDTISVSDLYFEPTLKIPVFDGYVSFKSLDGKRLFILAIFNPRKKLYNILTEGTERFSGLEALLVQSINGVTTYISDSKFLGDIAFRLQSNVEIIKKKKVIEKDNKNFIEGIDYRGEKVYAYINFLPKWNWFLLVKIDQDKTIQELKKTYYRIFGSILTVTLIFIITMTEILKREKQQFEEEKITLQKQKELIKKQYEYITKIANDAIIITDNQNRIVDYNDKFLEFYKIDNTENISNSFTEYLSENLKNQWNDYLRNIKQNNGLIFECVHKNSQGEYFTVQVSARFIEIEGNEFLIQIIRNFEERKRIEDELKAARMKAEESDRLKSNFLSMMSHEVRTPINIILGAVDIIKSNLDDEFIKQNEDLFDMITRNSKRLLTLINDIIDISRIESNELKLEFTIRNVESLILDVVSEYEPVALNKGLKIVTNFKAQNPYARIDEVRFLQIITNLVSNAIKFTSQGGITITTKNVDETIHISIKDTGIGIPESAMNDIFNMFRQAHEGYNRNYEGAGLGLTITQKLTKMMGGEITVESQVNIGSTFTVIFPIVQTEELDENLLKTLKLNDESSIKPTILIVENDKDEAFYLESLLIRLGLEYFTINEGKKILSFIKHKSIDCVIYSINVKNEIEAETVMEEIRKKIKLENLKMIALRSTKSLITESRLKEIGFNFVKSKPYSFEDLSKILYNVFSVSNN